MPFVRVVSCYHGQTAIYCNFSEVIRMEDGRACAAGFVGNSTSRLTTHIDMI